MAVDSYAIAAEALKQIIDLTFAPEQITADHDQLHEALGTDGPVVGIAPLREGPFPSQELVQETFIQVQFFDFWEKEIDPTQQADPRVITGYHARLKEAIRDTSFTALGSTWYFQWRGTEYPRDPTGNNTRFVMTVRAVGNNTTMVETIA